ncbi:plasmepsin VII [Plasmodium malariae]|uniref:Plasmepsin VII n=1 Tax=Plasmodium malariae TaxID=5858 RepID=A0A1A8VS96_PLAMA|nr:plasmepsin VII [Plasmodium malariae]
MHRVVAHISVYFLLKILLIKFVLSILNSRINNETYTIPEKNAKYIRNSYSKHFKFLEYPGAFVMSSFVQTNERDNVISIKLNKQDIPSKKISTYYGQVTIGKNSENKINVLFDTGSTEFWIPYENCKGSKFNNTIIHNKYKRTNSFKYKYDKKGLPSLLEVKYLSGKIMGFDGYDTVNLGKALSIPDTNIAFATQVDIPVLEDFKWDGILGLGFENEDSQKRGVKPFLDHVKDDKILTAKNYKNIFGYYISDREGYITFGGVDNRLKRSPDEEIIWTPVSTEMGFWTSIHKILERRRKAKQHFFVFLNRFDLVGIRKENAPNVNKEQGDELIVKYEGFHDGGSKSIVDTGTFLIYAPKKTMENYLNDLTINSCEDKHKLPYIIFQIRAKEMKSINGTAIIELVLSPNDYVIEYLDEINSTRECVLGIQADDQSEEDHIDGWTLGQVFLKSYYTIFDKDNLQIGFVRSKQNFTKDAYTKKSFLSVRSKRGKANKNNYNGPLQ